VGNPHHEAVLAGISLRYRQFALTTKAWSALIADFLGHQKCKTPFLFELGEEFPTKFGG
jgi:hypothetical protein